MPKAVTTLSSVSTFVLLGLWLAFGAGCSSEPRPEKSGGLAGGVPDYPTAMSGAENFAGGKIIAEVTLGLPTDFRPGKDGGGRSGGGHSGHHGGGRRSGGGMGGGMSGGGYPGLEGGAGADAVPGDDNPRPVVTGSTLPPAQLKLHLRNSSTTEAIACEVIDFNSSLGNFAVYPGRYELESGQSVVSETMTSRLGVECTNLPVTVSLRIAGQTEKKVITLHLLAPASEAPEPIPAAK